MTGRVAVDGGWLAYVRTGGAKPPLVLCHGLTDNGLCWRRMADALAPAFDVVMLDARGHGESVRCDGRRHHEPGEDLAQAIEGLGLDAPAVMGHSVGGRAAADFAAAHPDRLSRLVLEDPVFQPPSDEAALARRRDRFRAHVRRFQALTEAQILAEGRAASPGWHVDDLPDWARAKTQVDPEALPVCRGDWQTAVRALRVPAVVIHGEASRGSAVTPAILAEIRALNPAIVAQEIPGAGHNTRRENFAGVLAAARAALGLPPL